MKIFTGPAGSIPLMALILICFFLPFVDVQCAGEKFMTFTGLELAVGKEMPDMDMGMGFDLESDGPSSDRTDPEILAIILLVVLLIGLILSIPSGMAAKTIRLIVTGLAFLLIIILKVKLEVDTRAEGDGLLTLNWKAGYYLMLMLLPVSAIHTILGFFKWNGAGARTAPYYQQQAMPRYRTCEFCGAESTIDSAFCKNCGAAFSAPPPQPVAPPQPVPPPQHTYPDSHPPVDSTSYLFCDQCGSKSSTGMRFCGSCGSELRLPAEPAPVTPPGPAHAAPAGSALSCQLCGATNPAEAKYCKDCGALL